MNKQMPFPLLFTAFLNKCNIHSLLKIILKSHKSDIFFNISIFIKLTSILVWLLTKANENYLPTYAFGILAIRRLGRFTATFVFHFYSIGIQCLMELQGFC